MKNHEYYKKKRERYKAEYKDYKEYDSMPDFMKDFHEEMISRKQPDQDGNLKKREYILEWLTWFDATMIKMSYRTGRTVVITDNFMAFSKKVITAGFQWIVQNFAELDLGVSSAWYGAAQKAMRVMRTGKWDNSVENKLKAKFLKGHDRRW